VLWTFRDRILDLKKDKRFKYILLFKNHGEAAGASLEHAHSQLIAAADSADQRRTGTRRREAILSLQRAAACSATFIRQKRKMEAAWWRAERKLF